MKKFLSSLCIALSIIAIGSISYAYTNTYDYKETYTVSNGVYLTNHTQFTTEGWLKYNVLKIKLANKNVRVDSITNSESITKLSTTSSLAKKSSALAAINASFFVYGDSGIGYPIGTIIKGGNVISYNENVNATKSQYATLSISKANEAFIRYWKSSAKITAPTGKSITVQRFNKQYAGHKDYTILDRNYSHTSPGKEAVSDIVEMFVDKGVVTAIREKKTGY